MVRTKLEKKKGELDLFHMSDQCLIKLQGLNFVDVRVRCGLFVVLIYMIYNQTDSTHQSHCENKPHVNRLC